MFLQGDAPEEKEQDIISAAFSNALSQYFSGVTKGGSNCFVLVVYDKAMWEPVKRYYINYLQKEKQKKQEAKKKKLSL